LKNNPKNLLIFEIDLLSFPISSIKAAKVHKTNVTIPIEGILKIIAINKKTKAVIIW